MKILISYSGFLLPAGSGPMARPKGDLTTWVMTSGSASPTISGLVVWAGAEGLDTGSVPVKRGARTSAEAGTAIDARAMAAINRKSERRARMARLSRVLAVGLDIAKRC